VGGFPHGTFSPKTLRLADEAVAIDPDPLDSWIAVSRIISAYEQAIGLPEARIGRLRQAEAGSL
jgi:rRNA pseudouridine-1189 N-methylase Emg1 (Nep1/Mra1 family)